jgi:hypothetical protein
MEHVDFSANCPISIPLYYPEKEILSFNGFSWSNSIGILLQSNSQIINDPGQWWGTQDG